jgi:hypothetical protein
MSKEARKMQVEMGVARTPVVSPALNSQGLKEE